MALSRPFAYNNTGSPISGTTQYGDLVVGNIVADYAADYGGVVWWGGPDEDLRYIIGNARPGGQPVPSGVTETANVGFWGTPLGDKTDGAFLNLANYVGAKNGQPPFTNTNDAVTWLNDNGFYTSYNTVNVILEGFYFEGSVGAGYQATVTKPLNNDIIINFTDVLGTITGTPLLINSSVEILSGQTTGYTQTFTDYDYNNLTQENSFSGLTFNMTGSSQYYLVGEISGSTFNVTPTPTPTNSETPTNTPIPTNTPTNTTTPTPSVTPGLINGLVLNLDASNPLSYPGSGTTWFDISGSNNHIYWSTPSPQFIIDNGIKAIKTTDTINSLRAMVSTTYNNLPLGNSPYTAIAFFKPNATTSSRFLLSLGPADNSCQGTQIHPLAIGDRGKYSGGSCGGRGTWFNSSGVAPTTTSYVCVATTYGNGTEIVYVNGNLDKSDPLINNIPNTAVNKVCIGWVRDDGAGVNMDANIGLILFFNRELSAAEISQIYNDNKAKYNIN